MYMEGMTHTSALVLCCFLSIHLIGKISLYLSDRVCSIIILRSNFTYICQKIIEIMGSLIQIVYYY